MSARKRNAKPEQRIRGSTRMRYINLLLLTYFTYWAIQLLLISATDVYQQFS